MKDTQSPVVAASESEIAVISLAASYAALAYVSGALTHWYGVIPLLPALGYVAYKREKSRRKLTRRES